MGSTHKSMPVFGGSTVYSRKRPSRDQSWAYAFSAVLTNSASSPALLEGFWYKLKGRLRAEEKTIWLPSGDQTGIRSEAGSNVNRVVAPPRANSSSQMSRLPASPRDMAARDAFGDRARSR